MALVLRKAVLPKNVSLLKCFKGRPIATAANKKNPAAISTAVPSRSLRDKARMLRVGSVKIEKTKQLPSVRSGHGERGTAPLRFCMSCPDVPKLRSAATGNASPPRTRPICHDSPFKRKGLLSSYRTGSLTGFVPSNEFHTNMFGLAKGCCPPCSCGCKCPFPCGPCGCPNGCNCLPPPCNQPPKCIQYMTGYYYYPYGFWFCGPYHVTGTCTPVGKCGPCPCPSCPCAKCCACLSPVAAAVMGGPQQRHHSSAQRSPNRPLPHTPNNDNIKYPLPTQDTVQCNSASRNSSGISKFFPFNSVPNVDPIRRLPHNSVLMCPYSTVPANPAFPESKPVYCTPCIKQSKSNFSTRPRTPLSNNYQKAKKTIPNSFSKSYSDYIEKRSERRSPIHHKRSKKLVCEVCPMLENPRGLMSPEQRDRPHVYPGAFQYANIPNYRCPYPQSTNDNTFRAYEV